jgi:2-C-methyl-D-erythritol 2,4-cyclodiphosphate synthase
MRVGTGYDIHRFDPSRTLVLGGVHFEGEPGLAGHSDADVLLHAIIDALLGAAALGDIGTHFPPNDPQWADANSLRLLEDTLAKLADQGFTVGNIDATLIAEKPRLAAHIAEIRDRIADVLAVDPSRVNVKATTNEGLGAIGRGEGIAAIAVTLLEETASASQTSV